MATNPLQDLKNRSKKAIDKMDKLLEELKAIQAAYDCAADAWARERNAQVVLCPSDTTLSGPRSRIRKRVKQYLSVVQST